MAKESEACGRCSMTSVTDVTMSARDEEEAAERDPFGESRIEIDEDEIRRVSPDAWIGGIVSRLDELATRLTYGRGR